MLQTKRIKRYDKYKDSGIEWIGKIPQHWEICKLLKLFKDRKCPNKGNVENNVLSLSYGNIKRRNTETNIGLLPESFESYNIIEPNNIVLRLTDLQNDHKSLRCGLVKERGIITSAYITLELKDSKQSANYFYRLLHTFDIEKGFYGMGAGVRQSLKFEGELCNLYIIKPPVLEQQQIADYLYKKCCEIDEVVDKQKAVIEKLKEYKQSIITEAVTKGLDKSVPLKDSGIEWIGKIPQHWEIKRIKYTANYFEKGNGITKEDVVLDGDIQCIRYGEIYSKYDKQCVDCLTSTNLNKISSPKHISRGDILFAGTGELIEKIGKNIVYIGDKPCLAGGDIIILNHNQNPIFLNYALNSAYAQSQKSCGKVKLKVVHISASAIGDIRIAIPPIEEQARIADYLDKKYMEIDKIITDKKQVIEKLEEYKKSLIYECVTGKRKVI